MEPSPTPTEGPNPVTKKPLLASIALTAALVGGGLAGFLLGVPGVSQAQTTVPTEPPTTTAPDPGAPAPDAAPPERGPRGDGRNCPEKDGQSGDEGTEGSSSDSSATSTAFM